MRFAIALQGRDNGERLRDQVVDALNSAGYQAHGPARRLATPFEVEVQSTRADEAAITRIVTNIDPGAARND